MGKILGKIVGIEDGSKAAKQGQYQFDRANRLSDARIAELQGERENWERLFGPAIENLSEYINSLNPETAAARDIAAFEAQTQAVYEKYNEEFNTRFGSEVTASGLREAGLLKADLSAAQIRAQIKAGAADKVFQQKAQFVAGLGLPQKQQLTSELGAAFGAGTQAAGQAGAAFLNRANQKDQNFSSFVNSIVGAGAKIGAAYLGVPPKPGAA